jgi:hypothetical protein
VPLDQPRYAVLPRAATLGAGDPKHLQPPPQVAEGDRACPALIARTVAAVVIRRGP